MARVVDKAPKDWWESEADYPWHQWHLWLDGQVWELDPDTDIREDLKRFQNRCHRAARARRITVRTQRRDGKFYLWKVSDGR